MTSSQNPYEPPRADSKALQRRESTGADWLEREHAQAEVNRLLARGVVFSIIWLVGFGSAYSVYLASKAHRIMRRFPNQIRGRIRLSWCYLVGGLGVALVGSVIAVALMKRYV